MPTFRQRCYAVWGNTQTQDVAEYVVILAVILLLVVGTVKVIGKHRANHGVSPPRAESVR